MRLESGRRQVGMCYLFQNPDMPSNQTSIYATQGDLLTLVREICSERPLEFVATGLFDKPEPTVLNKPEDLSPFTAYLAFDKGLGITVRAVPQRGGAEKYAFDQLANPHTVILRCGGPIDGQRLIAGQIGTVSKEGQAAGLYSLFAKLVRRKFEKIKSYYVGPEAVRLLDQGVRLTPTEKSPETYDLVR